jgi:hypothetical protein
LNAVYSKKAIFTLLLGTKTTYSSTDTKTLPTGLCLVRWKTREEMWVTHNSTVRQLTPVSAVIDNLSAGQQVSEWLPLSPGSEAAFTLRALQNEPASTLKEVSSLYQ